MEETEALAERRIAVLRRKIAEHNRRYYDEAALPISDKHQRRRRTKRDIAG